MKGTFHVTSTADIAVQVQGAEKEVVGSCTVVVVVCSISISISILSISISISLVFLLLSISISTSSMQNYTAAFFSQKNRYIYS